MQDNKKVVVIGAGFGGLGSAIILAKQGYDVTVVEKNDKAGGRANLIEHNGYKRDMGPSRYLMPDAFDKFFTSIGEKVSDHFELEKLSPSYRVYFKNENLETKIDGVEIRLATIEDASAITDFRLNIWYDSYKDLTPGLTKQAVHNRLSPQTDKYTLELTQQITTQNNIYMILHDGVIVGYYKPGGVFEDGLDVGSMYISPEFQHKGIGNQLITQFLQTHRDTNIYAEVSKNNTKCIKFLSKLGFVRRSDGGNYEYKDGENISYIDCDIYKLDKSENPHSINNNTYLDIYSDIDKATEVFESIEAGAGDQLRKYLKSSEYQYNIAMNKFVYKNFDSIRDFMTPQLAMEGLQLNIFTTLYNYVSRFVKDERLKKILMYPSVFLGTSPYETPALFNIMSHVDFNQGVFYPKGGIYEIIKTLQKIATANGVKFLYNSEVEKIDVENGQAKGIYIGDKSENTSDIYIPADIIVSNADMHHTETRLLEPQNQSYPASYRAKKVISPSGFILYLGVDGELPQLQHHTLIFNHDRKEGFAEVFSDPKWPSDPSYYICNPSKTDPSTAPAGKENLFVLVPIAPGLECSDEILAKYSDLITCDIAKNCNIPDLASRIEFSQIFSIPQFEQYYNAYKGTALGLAHTFFQSAVRRPNNYSKKVKGLYYAGGYTTPGIGMPMCLISAMMVAERINKKSK